MKNKYILSSILFIAGIILLIFSLGLLNTTVSRWGSGALIFISVFMIGVSAKYISEEVILNKYLESKKLMNIKYDKKRENYVKQTALAKTNFMVSIILTIAIIIMFIINLNYSVLIIIIIFSIILQSVLNSVFYIYYDKKVKEKDFK